MLMGKTTAIASLAMAMALLAVPSWAGDYNTRGVRPTGYRTSRRGTAPPQRVKVWRGATPTLTSARLDDDDDLPPMPPDAPNGEPPWESEPSRGGSPFLDESYGGHDATCSTGDCYSGHRTGGGRCRSAPPWWAHRTFIYGEYLYLHPTGVDMAYAIQQNGVGGAGTTPEGRVGVVDQDYTSAYSVGFGVALSPCSSIRASYTDFYSNNSDFLEAPAISGGTVASLVFHPESINEGSTSSLVNASNSINFRTADVEYRRLLVAGNRFALNYSAGARYAKLGQRFQQIGNFAPPTGTIDTTTNITFEGGGLKVGLDGMQRLGNSRFGVYGEGFLSLIFGRFNSNYQQFNVTTTSIQAASNWQDDRVVPILEYELGVNFTSRNGHWRWSGGYYTAFWFNAIATPQYVQAVQQADFVDLGETIAFDGLVTRLEFRF